MSDIDVIASLKEISDQNKWINWSKKFEVGYKRIDEQHKELVNILNDLYEANVSKDSLNKDGISKIHSILKRLIDYTNYHFSIEEKIMKAVEYKDFKNHITKHRNFMDKIVEEINTYINGKNLDLDEFTQFLRDWLFHHISIEDKRFVNQLKEKLKALEESENK